MLHVTTEVGIPGKQERERRHFDDHNQPCKPSYKNTGRVYIPHGSGYEDKWNPHPQHVEPEPTEEIKPITDQPVKVTHSTEGHNSCGLDWKSRLKYLPPPQNQNKFPAAEIFPDNWHSLRSIPYTYFRSYREWMLDPADANNPNGLKTEFSGVHKASTTSNDEITHRMLFGRGRNESVINKRNGIPVAAPGDKNYQAVEYSDNFHVKGTTLPVVSFGASAQKVKNEPDTFIPLMPLPAIPSEPFKDKETNRVSEEEIQCVKDLDNWKPATPLYMTLPQEEKKDK